MKQLVLAFRILVIVILFVSLLGINYGFWNYVADGAFRYASLTGILIQTVSWVLCNVALLIVADIALKHTK